MNNFEKKSKEARRKILEMIHKAGTSHIASNLSCIDFATVLYEKLGKKDEVIWSKGWAAASIYYFIAKQGKIPKEDLEEFAKEKRGKIKYLGLAETTTPGVWCNGGAVGHGLPIAVGMALAKKFKKEAGKIYCILSDGELNEGTVWEAAMLANHHNLDNLIVIVDVNKWQAMGKTKDVINLERIERRWQGFGWDFMRIDGHNFFEIEKAIDNESKVKPYVIIADTIKGKGVSFMENHLTYHYKHVDEETYNKALSELQ